MSGSIVNTNPGLFSLNNDVINIIFSYISDLSDITALSIVSRRIRELLIKYIKHLRFDNIRLSALPEILKIYTNVTSIDGMVKMDIEKSKICLSNGCSDSTYYLTTNVYTNPKIYNFSKEDLEVLKRLRNIRLTIISSEKDNEMRIYGFFSKDLEVLDIETIIVPDKFFRGMLNNPERKYVKYPRGSAEHFRLSRFKHDGPLFTRVNGMVILDDLWIELRSNGNIFRFENSNRDVINLAYGLKDEFDIGLCSVMVNTRLTLIHDFGKCEECGHLDSLPHSCINNVDISKLRTKEICFINCDRTQDQLFSQENLELLNKLNIRLFISK